MGHSFLSLPLVEFAGQQLGFVFHYRKISGLISNKGKGIIKRRKQTCDKAVVRETSGDENFISR